MRILVTGASSSLGRAAAVALAKQGADLILVGSDSEQLKATALEVAKTGSRPNSIGADLSIQSEVRWLAETVAAKIPLLDVLINIAGTSYPTKVLTHEGVEHTFAINTVAPFLLSTMLHCHLARNGGRIINIVPHIPLETRLVPDRLVDPTSFSGCFAYSQAKLALLMVTQEQAIRYHGSGIKVVAVQSDIMPETKLGGTDSPSINHVAAMGCLVGAASPLTARTDLYASAAFDPHDTGSLLSRSGLVNWPAHAQDAGLRREMWQVLEKLTRNL